MDKVKKELEEYRQRKVRVEPEKTKIESPSAQVSSKRDDQPALESVEENTKETETRKDNGSPARTWNDILTSFLFQLLVWLVLLMVAVKLEFGMVYCVLTGFYVIWTNLSRRGRTSGELSAYSVFNPNCERLPGTLTAEQLEGELLHRPRPN